MKISEKITIIIVDNRESYCFIIIFKSKQVPLSVFSYRCWLQLLTTNKWPGYYKVYAITVWSKGFSLIGYEKKHLATCQQIHPCTSPRKFLAYHFKAPSS